MTDFVVTVDSVFKSAYGLTAARGMNGKMMMNNASVSVAEVVGVCASRNCVGVNTVFGAVVVSPLGLLVDRVATEVDESLITNTSFESCLCHSASSNSPCD